MQRFFSLLRLFALSLGKCQGENGRVREREGEMDKLLLSVYLLSLGFVIILKAQLVHVTTFAAVAQRLPLLENINKAKRATRRAPPIPGACLGQCTVGRG